MNGTLTFTGDMNCPNCGKPKYYVGDPVADISMLVCTCPQTSGYLEWKKFTPAPMGWECPRCHKINSPYMNQCWCYPEVRPEVESSLETSITDNAGVWQALADK